MDYQSIKYIIHITSADDYNIAIDIRVNKCSVKTTEKAIGHVLTTLTFAFFTITEDCYITNCRVRKSALDKQQKQHTK